MAGSGWNPNPEKDPPSDSPSRTEDASTAAPPLHILVVDDNTADVYLIREAIKTSRIHATIQIAKDGEDAIAILDQADRDDAIPRPGLLILDINLPKKSGHEVLEHLLRSPRCRNTPVIVVSTSDSKRDRDRVMARGAQAYFRKSSEFDEFMKLADVIRKVAPPKTPPA